MSLFFRVDHTTERATISHFLLMFGYKLFSFYFPLFLLSRGLAIHQIGYSYLLIYLPIAIASPFVGFLNYKIKPSVLISLGILGYAVYAVGMIFVSNSFPLYFLQVILGISAALFFVSHKSILIDAHNQKPAKSFGWFYSAPYYASEFAPLIGAVLIFRFGFTGVFIASFFVHILNIILSMLFFRQNKADMESSVKFGYFLKEFAKVSKLAFNRSISPFIIISLSVLFVSGFYQAFFVLFLKSIGWSQNTILIFTSLFSLFFVPLSLYGISILSKIVKSHHIFRGSFIFAVSSIIFAIFGPSTGFMGILILMEIMELGGFIANAGRSGILSKAFEKHSRETAALDTVFSPLGTAFGSLAGGLLIGVLGFPVLFISGGVVVLLVSLWAKLIDIKNPQ